MNKHKIQNNFPLIKGDAGKAGGFTLVELIVVITILAILGTIAFMSLQGYSQNSRDSVRISDISRMKTGLELFQLDAGKYPAPTEGIDVTYSGAVVWNQGIFGETTFSNVDKLDKIPLDPITNTEYTYSVTSTRNKFQIGGILEGDPLAFSLPVASSPLTRGELRGVFAAGTVEGTALISGTYNGQATKTLSGSTCDMIAVPSIIANDLSTTTDIVNLINSGSIVYNGFKNLPSSFKTSKFKYDGGFEFQPNNIIAYSDTSSCAPLLDGTNYTPRVQLLKGLQDSYSGTILSSDAEISRIVNLEINVSSPSEEVKNLAGNFVNNNLGGKVLVSTTPQKGCATQPSYSGATFTAGTATSVNQAWQSTNVNEACYWSCGAGNVLLGNDCVLENCSGTTPDGTTKVANAISTAGGTWNYNINPGTCTYTCNTGYHTEDAGTTCVSDTQSCIISNGTGEQTWGGSSWGTCTVTSCDANYVQSGNTCVLDTSWCAYGSTPFSNVLGWTNTELKYDAGTNKCYVFGDENANAQNACNKWITDNVTLGGSWIWVPARNFVTDGHGANLKDTFYQREVTYNGHNYVCRGFAVMKYEAKFTSTSGKTQPNPTDWATWATSDYLTDNDTFPETINSGITSKQADNPIAYIRQGEAIAACKGATTNQYHLITNNEWMAVARNIEAQTVNLKDGNKLYRGLDGGNGQYNEDGTLGCGKTGGQTTYWTAPAGTDNNSLSSTRSSCDDMRQNKLSNGSIVWDISGNVWEHVNKSNVANTSNDRITNSGWNTNSYSTEAMCSNGTWNWYGWNGTDAQSIGVCTMIGGYTQASYGPYNNWNADNGVGRIYANNAEDRDNIFLRGAAGNLGTDSGLFTMGVYWAAADQYVSVGFRCSW